MLDPFRARGYLRKVGDFIMQNEQLMTSGEVCDYCGFSVTKLNGLEKRGELIPVRVFPVSGKRLYARKDVVSYLESVKQKAEPLVEEEELMTSSEVCEYCCFSKSVLNRLGVQGLLVPAKVLPGNKKRLYSLVDVKSYMDSIKRV